MLLGCAGQKAIQNIAEFDAEKGIGLIEKKRLGLGKTSCDLCEKFYAHGLPETGKSKADFPELEIKSSENLIGKYGLLRRAFLKGHRSN